MKKFIVIGDFCCRSPAVLAQLLDRGHHPVKTCRDKKDKSKVLFFFKVTEVLKKDLEEILDLQIIYIDK